MSLIELREKLQKKRANKPRDKNEPTKNTDSVAGFVVVDSLAVGERIVVVTDPTNDAYRRARLHAAALGEAHASETSHEVADAAQRNVAPLAVYMPHEIEELRIAGTGGGKVTDELLRAAHVAKRALDGRVVALSARKRGAQ